MMASGTLTPLRSESMVPTSTVVGALSAAFDDAQPHLAVVEQQAMAGLERGEDLRMGQLDARSRRRASDRNRARRSGPGEHHRALGEGADAQLRSLQVGEDADRPADLGLDLADGRRPAAAACRDRCGSC